jgi:4-amino-4-deoxy-L-arabinose transferase-like glycosyltransferase
MLALAFLAAAGLNLLGLWEAPLADTTEARHAEVGREFAEGGHWLIPTLNYQPHLTKPPLTDWLVALGIKAFGANEFGARFFGALGAALGLTLVAGFAFRIAGRRAAIAASCFYLATPIYLVLSRTISIDILLATLAVGACWAAWEMSRDDCARPRTMALAYWGLLGLGALTKGHIVLLVALLPVMTWMLWGKRWQLARRVFWTPALLAFVVIAMPWYVYIASVFPGWLGKMASNELSQRTIGAEFGDANFGLSILYFLGGALLCIPPAILAFLPRRGTEHATPQVSRGALSLLACWIAIPLLVFSLASAQRANYIAPLVPAAALLAGLGWSRLLAGWHSGAPREKILAYLSVLALLLIAPGCALACRMIGDLDFYALAAMAGGALLLAGATTTAFLLLLRARPGAAGRSLLVSVLAIWLMSLGAISAVKQHRSMREACRQLSLAGIKDPVCFKKYFASAHFYLGNSVRLCDVNAEDFKWPEGTSAPLGRLSLRPHREVYSESRNRAGTWLLLNSIHEADLRRFAASRHMKLRTCWSSGELLAVRAQTRPPRVAPAPKSSKPPPRRQLPTVRPTPPLPTAARLQELMAQLEAADPDQRRAAAVHLGSLGVKAKTARAALVAATGDRDPTVRYNAARSLGKIPDPTGSSLPALRNCLRDSDWLVRRYAASSLGQLGAGDRESTAALTTALGDADWEVRRVAARSLGQTRCATPQVITGLTRLLKDEYWQARKYAAQSLGRLGAKARSALPELRRSLSDPEPQVRAASSQAIKLIAKELR